MAAIVTCCDIWHKVRSPMESRKDEEVEDMLDNVFGKSDTQARPRRLRFRR